MAKVAAPCSSHKHNLPAVVDLQNRPCLPKVKLIKANYFYEFVFRKKVNGQVFLRIDVLGVTLKIDHDADRGYSPEFRGLTPVSSFIRIFPPLVQITYTLKQCLRNKQR